MCTATAEVTTEEIMARTTILPLSDYPTGERTIGPANIQNGLTVLTVALSRQTTSDMTVWPSPSTTVDLKAEVTTEQGAGATWVFVSGITARGGIFLNSDGSELAETSWEVNLPAGTNRRLRVQSVIANGPLRTSVTVITA